MADDKELREYLSKEAAPYAAAIIDRVVKNQEPCVLVLPTGAGKSTVIPYAFIQAGYRVFISEPTIAMCSNVVQSFHDMFPSVSVGIAFGRENRIPKDARLIVATNGNLKKRLLSSIKTGGMCMSIDYTDILILDEVHMGGLDNHINVSLWYYCAMKLTDRPRLPRLLLSSATVGDALFSRRFSPCVFLPPELLTKTPYPVTPQWASRDYTLDDNSRYSDMGILLRALHESRPTEERIIAFLPGRQEMTKMLTASGLKLDVDITLVTIWSESTEVDYKPIKREIDPIRLVVFATPSADAGLTIIGLVHVIDSLLVKNSHTQPNGSEALITEIASHQLARQRSGRVGRKAPGIYYPMCTQAFYNSNAMPASYTLEIYRRPLYNDILELVAHGIQAEQVLSIYNIPSLPSMIEQLLQWGLLRRSATSGELYASSGGKFMTQTELSSPRLASVLYAWVKLEYPVTEGVILVHLIAGVTSKILQIHIPDNTAKTDINRLKVEFIRKYYGRFLGPSDVHTVIRLWNAIVAETQSSDRPGRPGDFETIAQWCTANAIQWRGIKNVIKSIQKTLPQIQREATRFAAVENIEKIKDNSSTSWLIDEARSLPVLRRIMEHVYRDQIAHRGSDSRAVYVTGDGSTIEPSRNAGFTLQADPEAATPYPKRIIIIGQFATGTAKPSLSQFLDIDDPSAIASISTEKLNDRLGIFVSGARRKTR